jgi:hypothetical protein
MMRLVRRSRLGLAIAGAGFALFLGAVTASAGDPGGSGGGQKPEVSEPAPPETISTSASHQWCPANFGGCLHWTKPESGPRLIILINNATDPWRPRLDGRAADWSRPDKINVNVDAGSTDAGLRQDCPMPDRYRRVRVCSYGYNNPNWLGLAKVSAVTTNGHIQQGWVKLDNADLDILDADGQRHVMCQEIGHNLGLKHWNVDGNNSCMNTGHINTASYDDPASHDINQVDSQTHHHGGSGANVDEGDPLNGDLTNCLSGGCSTVDAHVRQLSRKSGVATFRVTIAPTLPMRLGSSLLLGEER